MYFCRDRSANRTRITASIAAALVLAVAPLSSPAAADPYPAYGYPDKGDYHTYCFSAAFANYAGLVSRARYSMDNNDGVEAQTVVNTLEQACTASTDVKLQVASIYPYMGLTGCAAYNSNGYCDQWNLFIDWSLIQQLATDDGYQARKTICHEIGHTLGVDHYGPGHSPDAPQNSCMVEGVFDSGAAWTRQYGPHHKGHINGWFS